MDLSKLQQILIIVIYMQETFSLALKYIKELPATRSTRSIQHRQEPPKFQTRTNSNFMHFSNRLQRDKIKLRLPVV